MKESLRSKPIGEAESSCRNPGRFSEASAVCAGSRPSGEPETGAAVGTSQNSLAASADSPDDDAATVELSLLEYGFPGGVALFRRQEHGEGSATQQTAKTSAESACSSLFKARFSGAHKKRKLLVTGQVGSQRRSRSAVSPRRSRRRRTQSARLLPPDFQGAAANSEPDAGRVFRRGRTCRSCRALSTKTTRGAGSVGVSKAVAGCGDRGVDWDSCTSFHPSGELVLSEAARRSRCRDQLSSARGRRLRTDARRPGTSSFKDASRRGCVRQRTCGVTGMQIHLSLHYIAVELSCGSHEFCSEVSLPGQPRSASHQASQGGPLGGCGCCQDEQAPHGVSPNPPASDQENSRHVCGNAGVQFSGESPPRLQRSPRNISRTEACVCRPRRLASPPGQRHFLWLLYWPHITEDEGEAGQECSFLYSTSPGSSSSSRLARARGAAGNVGNLGRGEAPSSARRSSFREPLSASRSLPVLPVPCRRSSLSSRGPTASISQASGGRNRSLRSCLFASQALPVWRGLSVSDQAFYLVSPVSLFSLSPAQSPLTVLLNMAIFEGSAAAAAYCVANGVDVKALCHLMLFLGLRYRELSMVKTALGLLQQPQQMTGIRMLILYILHGYSTDNLVVPVQLPPLQETRVSKGYPGTGPNLESRKRGRNGFTCGEDRPSLASSGSVFPDVSSLAPATTEASRETPEVSMRRRTGGSPPAFKEEVERLVNGEAQESHWAQSPSSNGLEISPDTYYGAAAPGLRDTVSYLLDLFHFPTRDKRGLSGESPSAGVESDGFSSGGSRVPPARRAHGRSSSEDRRREGKVRWDASLASSPSSVVFPACAQEEVVASFSGFLKNPPSSGEHRQLRLLDGQQPSPIPSPSSAMLRGQAGFPQLGFPPPLLCVLPPQLLPLRDPWFVTSSRMSPACLALDQSLSPAASFPRVGLDSALLVAEGIEKARRAAARTLAAFSLASLSRPQSYLKAGSAASGSDRGGLSATLLFGDNVDVSATRLPGSCTQLPAGVPVYRGNRAEAREAAVRGVVAADDSVGGSYGNGGFLHGCWSSGNPTEELQRVVFEASASAAAAAASALLAVDKAYCSRLFAIIVKFVNALIGQRVIRKIDLCAEVEQIQHKVGGESRSGCNGSTHAGKPRYLAPCMGEDSCVQSGVSIQQWMTDELLELTYYLQFIRSLQQALILSLPGAQVFNFSVVGLQAEQSRNGTSLADVRLLSSPSTPLSCVTRQQQPVPRRLLSPERRALPSHDFSETGKAMRGSLAREGSLIQESSCFANAGLGSGTGGVENCAGQALSHTMQEDLVAGRQAASVTREAKPEARAGSRMLSGERGAGAPREAQLSMENTTQLAEVDVAAGQRGYSRPGAAAGGREQDAPPSPFLSPSEGTCKERRPAGIGLESLSTREPSVPASGVRFRAAASAFAVVSSSISEKLWPMDADQEAVIRDALLTGRVSSALVWLERRMALGRHSRRHGQATRVAAEDTGVRSPPGRGTFTWKTDRSGFEAVWTPGSTAGPRRGSSGLREGEEDSALALVQRIGRRMVFQLFCNQQVEFFFVGMQMLRQLGVRCSRSVRSSRSRFPFTRMAPYEIAFIETYLGDGACNGVRIDRILESSREKAGGVGCARSCALPVLSRESRIAILVYRVPYLVCVVTGVVSRTSWLLANLSSASLVSPGFALPTSPFRLVCLHGLRSLRLRDLFFDRDSRLVCILVGPCELVSNPRSNSSSGRTAQKVRPAWLFRTVRDPAALL